MLHGKRIDLRLIDKDDLEWLRMTRNKYADSFFTKDHITPQQQKAWYDKYSENVTDRMFVVQLKDGTLVGTLALYNVNIADRAAELGRTLLLEEHRGQGYMEEAVKLLVDHAFKIMRLWHIRLSVYLDNAAAIALYYKCGFEATQRPIMLMEVRNHNMDKNYPVKMNDFGSED